MSKYKERITLLFKEEEELDEVILYALNELAPKSSRPFKIKEMLKEYIKVNKPELYNEALTHYNDNQLETKVEKTEDIISNSANENEIQNEDNSHKIIKSNGHDEEIQEVLDEEEKDELKTKARKWL